MFAKAENFDPVCAVPPRVSKRNGASVPFDSHKILRAILKAGQATGEFGQSAADEIAGGVTRTLGERYAGGAASVENIQDIVERQLVEQGFFTTARAYIVYREQHRKLRNDRECVVDVDRKSVV